MQEGRKQNPFSYTFGIKPREYIRNTQSFDILENFSYEDPTERAFMITGIRGSGKTVMLADISEQMTERNDWIIIDLNPSRDLLQSLGAQLYELPFMRRFFTEMKIDLSLFGFGISVEKGNEIFDIESAVEKMLFAVGKEKKKILVTIDEAAANKNMQIFCLSFQRMIRKQLPVYLIMTGLYENIHNLKNMEGCTFLQRAPFIVLRNLDISAVMVHYKKAFDISKEDAIALAKYTKGYPFAFQVLGKLYFDKRGTDSLDDIILEYESELIVYSYNKIWTELSDRDKDFVRSMALLGGDSPIERKAIMEKVGFSSSMMNRYQARLKEKGILDTESGGFGKYVFALPMFSSFVRDYHMDGLED